MSVIWYKIWFDLWHNKTRTLLAVLSIAAGVFAVGAIFGMSEMLIANMDSSHPSRPCHAYQWCPDEVCGPRHPHEHQGYPGRGRRGTLQFGERALQASPGG